MGVLSRMLDLSKAAVHEALDKLESPGMMLNHYLRSMEEEIHSVQQALVKQTAAERGLEQQIADYNRLAGESERKAAEALADDRPEEARQAIELKLGYLDKAAAAGDAYEAGKLRLAELERQLEQAKAEYARLQAKRDELGARLQKAKAKVQTAMPSFSSGVETGSAARGFGRIEQTILRLEAQAELNERAAKQEGPAPDAAREALIEEQLNRLRSGAPRQV